MPKYLRMGPVVTNASGYIQTVRQPFEWVDDIINATMDQLEAVQVTQQQLMTEHQIETEAVEVPPSSLPCLAGPQRARLRCVGFSSKPERQPERRSDYKPVNRIKYRGILQANNKCGETCRVVSYYLSAKDADNNAENQITDASEKRKQQTPSDYFECLHGSPWNTGKGNCGSFPKPAQEY
jgi:hypothetical protein